MKLKIITLLSLLSFVAVSVSVIGGYIIVNERQKGTEIKNSSKFGSSLTDIEINNDTYKPSSTNEKVLTTADVLLHSTSSDCWIIINEKVYGVTTFLIEHPGGASVITPYCGKDASNGFNTKDKNPPSKHSTLALNLLSHYFVGDIGSAVADNGNSSGSLTNASNSVSFTNINKTPTPKPTTTTQTTTIATSNITLNTAEVAGHNTTSNCWLIISNNVYNVTNYLVQHPGGVNAIAPYCGNESTQAFQTRGGRGNNHSNSAYNLLNNFLVGSIGSTIQSGTGGTTNGNTTNPTPLPTISGGGTNTPGGLPASVSAKYPGATLKKMEDNGREMEIFYNGSCRHIKIDSSGNITDDQSC